MNASGDLKRNQEIQNAIAEKIIFFHNVIGLVDYSLMSLRSTTKPRRRRHKT
jgi:hypothetical protein